MRVEEEEVEVKKIKIRKDEIVEALKECREDIKLLAFTDKFAYLSIIDDTLSDDYLRKVAQYAYELM